MAENLLQKWGACLNDNDLEGIVNLYTEDAVLWGTFSEIIRDNHDLIREYFEALFLKDDLNVKFGESNLRSFGEAAIYSGEYEFSYHDDKEIKCPARFSFVFYRNKDGEYRIIDHHSSLFPGAS